MYKHVLFDLDGTLVDTLPLIEYSYRTLFQENPQYGDLSEEAMRLLGLPLTGILERLVPAADVPVFADEYMRLYREKHDELIRSYPGMLEAVAKVVQEGAVVGVVTSKARETTEWALDDMGLLGLVDVIITAEDVKSHKPSPDPILTAMRMLQAPRNGTLYVGDSPFDIQAARAAGVDVAAVTWGAFDKDDLKGLEPTYLLDEPGELIGVVLGKSQHMS